MLSRTAADLYWMSRHLERAENLARMLDVSYSLSLMPQDGRGDGLDELAMPLLITGTHFSTAHVDAVARHAISFARNNNTKVILDIDYRPVLWGLTRPGDGDTRFVSNHSVTAHLQSIVPLCDLIVGTEEEFHIAGGSTDTLACLRKVRELSDAVLVLKRGAEGCSVFDGAIPADLNAAFFSQGVRVEVLNVLGAGDAFMAGFLRGWLRDEPYSRCCAYANASGALVVACARPLKAQRAYYLVQPEGRDNPPDTQIFLDWLVHNTE